MICIVFALHFYSPSKFVITISEIGLVKKMAFYMSGFLDDLCKFLGARAPLELANVKKKQKNLFSPASTCTLILNT